MKICAKCKQEKPETEYTFLMRNKDGLHNMCKDCSYQRIKYRADKYAQWLSLKKRATNNLNITQAEFYKFVEKNEKDFQKIADQKLTPYVDRIEDFIPYQLGNLKVKSRPRTILGFKGVKPTGEEIRFGSGQEAEANGFSRKLISVAICRKKPYKEYLWEYIN